MVVLFVLWDYLMSLLIFPLVLIRGLFVDDMEFLDKLPGFFDELT